MRALFIDDDLLNRTVMAAMLSTADVVMEEAENGAAGLARVDEAEFDFILVDLRMPQMDGFEVVRRIRSRGDEKATAPIIIVTADTSQSLTSLCMEAGADAMITKPVDMVSLFEMVGKVLASRS